MLPVRTMTPYQEIRAAGRTLHKEVLDAVDPVAAGLEPLETEVLEAHRRARTSFLATETVLPREYGIRLCDLLEPDRPETVLTDMGLSDGR
jgi:hypothetical protein